MVLPAGFDSLGVFVGGRMADIILFRRREELEADDEGIDLLTAVDAAIRDLREIATRWEEEASKRQAADCLLMLERAFQAAV
jgi:Zn-dependent protease with chaperone function